MGMAAVFGIDDRVMLTPDHPEKAWARSTAVAVLNSLETETSPGFWELDVDTSKDFLCSDEKFYNRPSLSYACSGVLVAPDLLITAGHCMVNKGEVRNEKGMYCEAYSTWIFDYAIDRKGKPQTQNIPAKNRYTCKQIVYAVSDAQNDYALIQLDRPVEGRRPLRIATEGVRPAGRYKMAGHPLGLPTVLSRNARVLEDDPSKNYFVTNLDAFIGNSGSGVVNSRNEVVGILISGTPSSNLIKDEAQQCERINSCDENGHNCLLPDVPPAGKELPRVGSEVQRIAPVLEVMKEFERNQRK